MRHGKRTAKLGRTGEHRNAMLANMVCSLIKHGRITTTLAKAKAARPYAEKMMTLAKKGSLHDRRNAASRLHQEDMVRKLFTELAEDYKDRPGGYTRIIKLEQRRGDAAQKAILEWVEGSAATSDTDADDSPREVETEVISESAESKEEQETEVSEQETETIEEESKDSEDSPEKKD